MYHEMFPEEVLALQQELKNHPDILKKLEGQSLEESLAIIGADLGILLDGMYDIPDLCRLLIKKLKERDSIIMFNSPELIEAKIVVGPDSITIEQAIQQSSKPESK